MHVVQYSDDYFPNIGGVAAAVHGISHGLTRLGVHVQVVTHAGTPRTARNAVEQDVPTLRLPGRHPWGRYQAFCRGQLERALGREVLQSGNLIVHSHWDHPWWIDFPIKKVFTNHTSLFLQDCAAGKVDKWVRRFAQFDHIITASELLRQRTLELGIPEDKVTYLHNGVNEIRFVPSSERRQAMRQKLGIAQDAIAILCAKRCVPVAGVIDFAHALRYIEAQVPAELLPRVEIVFAGNREPARDDYEKETLEAFGGCALGRRARILGEVPNAEMQDLFAAVDLSVLPSLKEATSISGLESMACGVPIVGTRIGGIPVLVEHGEDGLLVDHGNSQQLADAIVKLIVTPDLRETFSRRVREKVEREFSWTSVATKTRAIYERILQN